MAQTMAEYLIQQGEARGEKRGEKQGAMRAKREALLKLLDARFETVPQTITKRITAMRSPARLDALFEQALYTKALDDIDWETAGK